MKAKNNYCFRKSTPQAAIPVCDTKSVSPTLTCMHSSVLILCHVISLLRLNNRNTYAFLNAPNSVTASGSQFIWFYHFNNTSESSKVWNYSEQARGLWKDTPQQSASPPILAMNFVVDSSNSYYELKANNTIYTQRTTDKILRKPKVKSKKKKKHTHTQLIGEASSHGLDLPAPATALSTTIFICRRCFRQRVTYRKFPPSTFLPTTLKVCNKLLL